MNHFIMRGKDKTKCAVSGCADKNTVPLMWIQPPNRHSIYPYRYDFYACHLHAKLLLLPRLDVVTIIGALTIDPSHTVLPHQEFCEKGVTHYGSMLH